MAKNSVLQMLRDHAGDETYHPLCSLLDLTKEKDATISEHIAIHKTISKYVEAENKAVEFSGKVESGVRFKFDVS